MASFGETAKAVATATQPREFDLSYSTTLEEVYEKLSACAAAFQMPFSVKGGVAGQRIVFEREKNLDVALWLYVKECHIRVQPNVSNNTTSVNGMRVDKKGAMRSGVKNVAVSMPIARGEYIDAVTETVRRILNGEPVEDYVAPVIDEEEVAEAAKKDWLATLLLCIFFGGLGVHRYYVGKIGTGILWTLTGGCFGIGYIVDLIKIIVGKFKDKSGNYIVREK